MVIAIPVASRKPDRRTAAETAHVELAARRQEQAALAVALRVVARDLEGLAWSQEGDARTIHHAGRLKGMADQIERRWEAVA